MFFSCVSFWVSPRSLPSEKPTQLPPPAGRGRPATVMASSGPQVSGCPWLCGVVCTGRIAQTHTHDLLDVFFFFQCVDFPQILCLCSWSSLNNIGKIWLLSQKQSCYFSYFCISTWRVFSQWHPSAHYFIYNLNNRCRHTLQSHFH